jgi:hypothetical protein
VEPLLHELGEELEAQLAIAAAREQAGLSYEQRRERGRGARLNLAGGVHQLRLAHRREEQYPRG